MGIRPRTTHVKRLKARRCQRCGAKVNSQRVRCKRCHTVLLRPRKTSNS